MKIIILISSTSDGTCKNDLLKKLSMIKLLATFPMFKILKYLFLLVTKKSFTLLKKGTSSSKMFLNLFNNVSLNKTYRNINKIKKVLKFLNGRKLSKKSPVIKAVSSWINRLVSNKKQKNSNPFDYFFILFFVLSYNAQLNAVFIILLKLKKWEINKFFL